MRPPPPPPPPAPSPFLSSSSVEIVARRNEGGAEGFGNGCKVLGRFGIRAGREAGRLKVEGLEEGIRRLEWCGWKRRRKVEGEEEFGFEGLEEVGHDGEA